RVVAIGLYGYIGNSASSAFAPILRSTSQALENAAATSGSPPREKSGVNTPIRLPASGLEPAVFTSAGHQLNGASSEVRSAGSGPAIAESTSPQSTALLHNGPSLSIVQERAIAPKRLTRP